MHDALTIVDIILQVIQYLSFEDVTRLALVHRGWKELALEARWSDAWVPMKTILKRLGPLRKHPQSQAVRLNLEYYEVSTEHWQKFLVDTHKIKRIIFNEQTYIAQETSDLLQLLEFEWGGKPAPMFPNLRDVDHLEAMMPYSEALNGALQWLPNTRTSRYDPLDILGMSRSNIRNLRLFARRAHFKEVVMYMAPLDAEYYTELETIYTNSGDLLDWHLLGHCSKLKRVVIRNWGTMAIQFRRREQPVVLPALTALDMDYRDTQDILYLLEKTPMPKIENVQIRGTSLTEQAEKDISGVIHRNNSSVTTIFTI